jgi:hypothetical protein
MGKVYCRLSRGRSGPKTTALRNFKDTVRKRPYSHTGLKLPGSRVMRSSCVRNVCCKTMCDLLSRRKFSTHAFQEHADWLCSPLDRGSKPQSPARCPHCRLLRTNLRGPSIGRPRRSPAACRGPDPSAARRLSRHLAARSAWPPDDSAAQFCRFALL